MGEAGNVAEGGGRGHNWVIAARGAKIKRLMGSHRGHREHRGEDTEFLCVL